MTNVCVFLRSNIYVYRETGAKIQSGSSDGKQSTVEIQRQTDYKKTSQTGKQMKLDNQMQETCRLKTSDGDMKTSETKRDPNDSRQKNKIKWQTL